MPQFEPSTMPSQLFWLVISFVLLYFILWKLVLPRISSVLEARQDKIEEDLGRAEKLKTEAEAVLADYRKALDEARAAAQADLKAAADAMATEAAKRQETFKAELASRTGEAERRIAEAKQKAIEGLKPVAAEAATAATERLIGLRPSEAEAGSAVDRARGAAGAGGD